MKIIFSFCLMIWAFNNLQAQDIITFKNGDQIKCKVTEVGVAEIKYKKQNAPDALIYVIDKSTVFMINYEDGSKEIINENTSSPEKLIKKNTINTRKGFYVGLNIDPGISYLKETGFTFTNVQGQIIGNYKGKLNANVIGGLSLSIYPINRLGLSTGFNIVRYGTTINLGQSVNGSPIILHVNLKYLNIPLSFSFIFGQSEHANFYFDIGPQFGLLLSGSAKDKLSLNNSSDIKDNYKNTQIFLNSTVGVNIPIASNRMSLDIGPYFNMGLLNSFNLPNTNFNSQTYAGGLAIHLKANILKF